MGKYFSNMNTYHISYAAEVRKDRDNRSYIRGRRYIPAGRTLRGTRLAPDYDDVTGFFAYGIPHQITVIKRDRDLYMKVQNTEKTQFFHMKNAELPIIREGRIGLRQMFTRSAIYKNFKVSVPGKS